MKAYTVRFAHLEEIPIPLVGDIIYRGDKVGRMGNTGKSTAAHLHIDVIEGLIDHIVRLKDIGYETENEYMPNLVQLNHFIDPELFGVEYHITEYYGSPDYGDKLHHAYDMVPINRHETTDNFSIYWNRSKTGIILNKGFDPGYGNYILIGFEI